MRIPVSDAKAQLTELVRRAEEGEEVVLTRHGQPAARLVPVAPARDAKSRRNVAEKARAMAQVNVKPGADAARSQDFLYREDGLPV